MCDAKRSSFLKKRSKRLLQIQVFVPPGRSATAPEKVFWFFSSEKNAFLGLSTSNQNNGAPV
jgi:hypothetical protein